MNITFGSAHLRTLAKLQELSLKHKCIFSFGFGETNCNSEIDYNILEKNGLSNSLIKEIKKQDEDNFNICDKNTSGEKMWFELYDTTNETYHQLVYIESSTNFVLKGGDSLVLENAYEHEELCDFINNNEYDGYFSYYYSPTKILNFGTKGWQEDYRVYRSGMALKFFGDLVCEYLGEPLIKETY